MLKSKIDHKLPAEMAVRTKDRVGLLQWLAIALAIVVTVVMFSGVKSSDIDLHAFEFSYNPFAWLSLAAVVANLALLVVVSRVKARTDDLVWLSLYIACLLIWSVAEFFTRISATPDASLFWWPVSTLPSFFAPVTLFMFVLAYTRPRHARHTWTIVSLFTTASMLVFFDLRTSLINHYNVLEIVPTPWNGAVTTGSYYGVTLIWILGLTGLSVSMLVRFYRRTLEPTLKRQARLFLIALLVPVVIGAVTDGLLPAIGDFNVLPVAMLLTAVEGGIITYGILRYRFLTLSPQLIATNILETINEAVIGVKPDLTVMYANKGAEQLLGYKLTQFSKLQFTNFLSQEWNIQELKKVLFGMERGVGANEFNSIDLVTATGTIVTAKLSVSPVVEDGELEGHLVVMTDVSQMARQKQVIEQTVLERTREVQETKATLVASINSMKLGFIITDSQPEVIRVNTVAHNLFCPGRHNHTAGDCHEVTIDMVQRLMGKSFSIAEDIAVCLKKQLPHEVKDVTFNERTWRLYLSPMVVDRMSIGCAVLFQDTTEERLLSRSRDEFFSIASHELRTPLTSIKGNSSLILQYYKEILKDKSLNEMIVDSHDSSERRIEIVNDFLDVSRVEQGRLEFHLEQLSLAKVIEEVVYGMNALLKQKGLTIKLSANIRNLDALPHVVVDRNRLKQVLFNLLGNAVKFTQKGSVKVEAVVEEDAIMVTVTDTGIGISPESQALLFHKFQQAADSILTRDSSHGTGLGLYISRLLAVGMGGELGLAKSTLGKGSTFFVRVPLSTPARLKRLSSMKLSPEK